MNIDDFNKHLDQIMPSFEKEFQTRTEQRTPVSHSGSPDDGKLKESWSWTGEKDKRQFSNEQDYAVYVEFGTVKMKPAAMLQTTIKETDDILKKAIKDAGL